MDYSFREKLYIWLSSVFETGANSAHKLVEIYGGIESLYDAVLSGNVVLPSHIRSERHEKLKRLAPMAQIDGIISELESYGVRAITYASGEYPKELRAIYDPPLVLYARGTGRLDSIRLPFAIIGSRHCTEYGERMAKLFGKTLADHGMTIVSGLAYGCDALASEGALMSSNAFPTVAVLGQGVMIEKHDSTSKTMDAILERGLVISEMLPKSRAFKGSYPLRNRIISGISRGLLIVEAGERSGTMITANAAMEQGRMLFALPGRITDRMSAGTNMMIKLGAAQAVYDTTDILDYFGISAIESPIREASERNAEAAKTLDGECRRVYDMLLKGSRSFDTLCELSGISAENLNLYLTELELSGLIIQLPGRVYSAD